MKITIDTSCLIINPFSGLSTMVTNLINYLILVDKCNQYTFFYNYFRKYINFQKQYSDVNNFTLRLPRKLIKFCWDRAILPVDCYLPPTDIYHSLHIQVPPTKHIKTVLTVHDCRYLAHPEFYSNKEIYEYKRQMQLSLNRVDHVIAISNFTKQEIVRYFDYPESNISVIYNGFCPDSEDVTSLSTGATIGEKMIIPDSYMLFIGPLEPRKNLDRLLYAYQEIYRANSSIPDLVIAGIDRNTWFHYLIKNNIGIESTINKIHLTGFLTKYELNLILSKAKALCYPSIYEGFGYPPLEAMSFGVPVISSDKASLPEVVGDASSIIDPYSIDSIAKGLNTIIYNKKIRADLIKKGFRQIQKFSWPQTAQKYVTIYNKLASHEL